MGMFWFTVTGSLTAVVLAAMGFWHAVRRAKIVGERRFFGTELHPLTADELYRLPNINGNAEAR